MKKLFEGRIPVMWNFNSYPEYILGVMEGYQEEDGSYTLKITKLDQDKMEALVEVCYVKAAGLIVNPGFPNQDGASGMIGFSGVKKEG